MSHATMPHVLPENMKILLSQQTVEARILQMAQDINQQYRDTSGLVLICILRGGFMFLSDLMKHLTVPCQVEFIRLASYGDSHQSSGTVKPVDLTLPNLTGKDVLVVEDIIDTGLTLSFFMEYLASLHTPRSLRLAVLLDKKETRQKPVETHYIGFEIENKYVVGYGLDSQGFYRNLPFVAYLESDETA